MDQWNAKTSKQFCDENHSKSLKPYLRATRYSKTVHHSIGHSYGVNYSFRDENFRNRVRHHVYDFETVPDIHFVVNRRDFTVLR